MTDDRPKSRPGRTYDVHIGDARLHLFMTTGEWPAGRVQEVFLVVSKQGSVIHGLTNSVALLISHTLQDGPNGLMTVCESLIDLAYEPWGHTDDIEIPFVKSVSDYIARRLAKDYCTDDERTRLGL